jgi:hypothetical protein
MIPPSVPRTVQEKLTFDTFAGKVRTVHELCGKLTLPTGKLVAADAPDLPAAKPFKTMFPIGEHPVLLTVARYEDKDERIAAARVQFAKGNIASWEQASPDMVLVDSGTAALCDIAIVRDLSNMPKKDQAAFFKRIEKSIDANYRDTRSHADLRFSGRSGPNVIACSSGFGDGGYGAYLALDSKRHPLSLLLDFGLLLTQPEIDEMADQQPFED